MKTRRVEVLENTAAMIDEINRQWGLVLLPHYKTSRFADAAIYQACKLWIAASNGEVESATARRKKTDTDHGKRTR